MRKVMKNVISVLVLVWACLSCFANNVRLNGTVKVTDVTSGVVTLELDLAWDNSWRDNFNWDAVWIFLKYKPASGEWLHVFLQETGSGAATGYQVMHGKNSNGSVVGVYVFLDKNDVKQHASTTVTLKWACPANYTKADFDENKVFLLAQGIEMVYIPFGAYYLGDGVSDKTFGDAEGNPLLINGEESISIYQGASSDRVVISERNADYPKGYHGFYIMKYETSQEQYVTFLNTLTKAQQETLLGESFLSALSPGRYIFGDTLRPSYRNGIVLSTKPEGQPYVFDNDLNGNGVYGEDGDGQCVACNYISLNDVLAYACWAGLRPMSELEYERVCRAPFPQTPMAGEYPWNNNSGVSRVTGLSAGGKETEVANSSTCNVNSGNGLTGNNQGPVRCGLFARSTSTQQTAGATYWGVMEMGGNVQEMVASVANSSLSRKANGIGYYAPGLWGTTAGQFGVRGGSFAGADSLLRTSDRSRIFSYFSSLTSRDSTVGFRLVRSLDENIVTINPGAISLSGPVCPGDVKVIQQTAPAEVTGIAGNFPLTYQWSYSTDGQTWEILIGETGAELTYRNFQSATTYLFRRKVLCALGEAQSMFIIRIPNMNLSISPLSGMLRGVCDVTTFIASNASSYTWSYNNRIVGSGPSYIPDYGNFGDSRGDLKIVCQADIEGCPMNKEITVTVGDIIQTFVNCGDYLVDDCGNSYATKLMADGHCWMVQNLRMGNCNALTFNTYSGVSAQDKIAHKLYGVCIPSPVADGGYLYNWQAALQTHYAHNSVGNPSGNVNGNSPNQYKGICPTGWHLPSGGSGGEFQRLYAALGNTFSKIYPGNTSDGWRGVLGGIGRGSSVTGAGTATCYWSSTYGSASSTNSYNLSINNTGSINVLSTSNYRSDGFAVRCVKDY